MQTCALIYLAATTKGTKSMGKSQKAARKRARKKEARRNRAKKTAESSDDELISAAAAWADVPQPVTKKQRTTTRQRVPPPFPKIFQSPSRGFLRDEEPYRTSFQGALDTAYEGCVFDGPDTFDEPSIQSALLQMDKEGLFRTDVTQPAGLGGKCVKTYVTRCLLGDEGTTYKYLGLRMFSHPWITPTQSTSINKVQSPIQTMWKLNHTLTDQTKKHLKALEQKRLKRKEAAPVTNGRPGFHVTLVNKMKASPRLKEEPMYGTKKCSVSWHADSSLEHYSTIAAYHTIVHGDQTNNDDDGDWSIALRVTHNAEGPKAKRLSDITVDPSSPPVAVTLPSGSAYYLLDDHNHHHQHAVLAPEDSSHSVRFSSTHRLLREGHNVEHILERCQTVCANFHRNGPKRWRAEQVLLNDIEFEWLRQFFIQGSENKMLLWGYWEGPIRRLCRYWELLENRTRQVLLTLRYASEAHCGLSGTGAVDLREKRTKALATIKEILGNRSPKSIYDRLSAMLRERSTKRALWLERERDPVFKRMPSGCRPLTKHFVFGRATKDHQYFACSELPDHEGLADLANHVKTWGVCYENQNPRQLPQCDFEDSHAITNAFKFISYGTT